MVHLGRLFAPAGATVLVQVERFVGPAGAIWLVQVGRLIGPSGAMINGRLDDRMGRLNEQEDALLYSLTSNLARSAKSVGAKRYSASMKSSGTFGDDELQEALAKESGAKIEYIRYLEELRHGIIEKALRDGKKVFVKGVAVVSGTAAGRTLPAGRRDPLRPRRRVQGRRGGPRGRGQVKKTALVCMLAGTAAKGKATLEVVLASEEPNTYRFTASRKVTVR